MNVKIQKYIQFICEHTKHAYNFGLNNSYKINL